MPSLPRARALRSAWLGAALLLACTSPDSVQPASGELAIKQAVVALNPSGSAPLSALLRVETSVPSQVAFRLVGRRGAASDVARDFDTTSTVHNLEVLGLYPDFANTVEIIARSASGGAELRQTLTLQTAPLPEGTFPAISIDTKLEGRLAPGMTLVSYFGYRDNSFPQSPFIFDAFGDIRWYLDFRTNPSLKSLFYDDGVERLRNGNLFFGDVNSSAIYEVDKLGRIIDTWPMLGYTFHHEVIEKPNGNFLATVTKVGAATVEDFVIEIDRTTRQIIRTWDLRASLQPGRRALTQDAVDWIHVNAITYDARDSTIIISGRTQGIVKLDAANRVVWILGNHSQWGTAGNGTPLAPLLLQPLDRAGQPITDRRVLDGEINHPDFEWNWYQHAPLLMPNGHLMLFDNGDNRNFSGAVRYSRAVEYEIDAAARTVRQVWQYGKENGASTYSRIVSDVDFLAASNHVIFSPGAVAEGPQTGKIVELDYATGEVVFRATVTPPRTFFGITFHRTERLPLYP